MFMRRKQLAAADQVPGVEMLSTIIYVRFVLIEFLRVIKHIIGCSNFAEPGYRLSYSITREATSARDSADCEEQCLLSSRFACKTFAFRYGSTGSKNCELSDRDFRDIQLRTDLDPDRDWDVFERTRYSGECRDKSGVGGNGDSIIIDRLSRRTS